MKFISSRWLLAAIYLPALTALALITAAAHYKGIPIGRFTRDMATVAGAHPLHGVLSNVGILLWCSGAAVCFFSAAVTHRWQKLKGDSRFLLFSGIFTLILMLDDQFLIHEWMAAEYLGINEMVVFSAYLVIGLLYLSAFRRTFPRTDYRLFISAVGLLGASVLFDMVSDDSGYWHFLIEDGLKFLGIANWTAYFTRTSFLLFSSNVFASMDLPQMQSEEIAS